jgi:hypothetical protein
MDQKYQIVIQSAGEGFQEYLAERGYDDPTRLTLGLLKAYAKAFREGKHLERANQRTFAAGLPEE